MEESTLEYNYKIEEEAIAYIKRNQKLIQSVFADPSNFPPANKPVSIFMAGSPGAGKTEFSKRFIKDSGRAIVRIDADDIRNILPMYNTNASLMQKASALGVEKVYDFALHHCQDLILDGTLVDFHKAESNIQRSLNHNRLVQVFYIYQDPVVAWEFTKKRELIEHREIPKDFFIKSFFQSKDNANRLKAKFGEDIELNLVIKNFQNDIDRFMLDIDEVDSYLKMSYTEDILQELLQ